jgi:hypothetical protein
MFSFVAEISPVRQTIQPKKTGRKKKLTVKRLSMASQLLRKKATTSSRQSSRSGLSHNSSQKSLDSQQHREGPPKYDHSRKHSQPDVPLQGVRLKTIN